MPAFDELSYGSEVPSNFRSGALSVLVDGRAEEDAPKAAEARSAVVRTAAERDGGAHALIVVEGDAGLRTLSATPGAVADPDLLGSVLGRYGRDGETPVPFGPRIRHGDTAVLPVRTRAPPRAGGATRPPSSA